ncbi:MAG: RES family NAD+ phosphorylase [Planctomycetes bacterium]|nr:RES family NAD+ phosphorylase [Planctomycetota bacterium]
MLSKIREYAALNKGVIIYCSNCKMNYPGEWSSVQEQFEESSVPQNLQKDVVKLLRCSNCQGALELGTAIFVYRTEKRQHTRQRIRWDIQYGYHRFKEFENFMKLYPYLGLEHEIGKEILADISKFKKITIKEQIYYRARRIEGDMEFAYKDMWPPDPEQVEIPEGRFNHFGQSYFYLGSTDKVAAKETLTADEKQVRMQKFKIHQLENILDMTSESYLHQPEAIPALAASIIHNRLFLDRPRLKGWKPEYFIPRFIADVAKYKGFSGILYDSARDYSKDKNLVLWKPSQKRELDVEGGPYIFQLPKPQKIIKPKNHVHLCQKWLEQHP